MPGSDNEIAEIRRLINLGDEKLREKSEFGILFLGPTGAGKTTTLCLLTSKPLKGILNLGDTCIDLAEKGSQNLIGHRSASCTTIPNSFKDPRSDVIYRDCPGFEDTKSLAQEIANAYYTKKISESHNQLKFVLVIPHGLEKQNRGNLIVELLLQLLDLVENKEILNEGLSIIITKCPQNYQVSYFIKFLATALEENNKFEAVSDLVSKLIREPGKFCIFKKPKESDLSIDLTDKRMISDCINFSSFIRTRVLTSIGKSAKLKVEEIIRIYQEEVRLDVEEFVVQLYLKFKTTTDIKKLKQAKNQLESFAISNNPTIDKFGKLIESLCKFILDANECTKATNLISNIKFYDSYSNVEHKFNVAAWTQPFIELNLKISEQINMENEKTLKKQVEEYKSKHQEEVQKFERVINEHKRIQANHECQLEQSKKAILKMEEQNNYIKMTQEAEKKRHSNEMSLLNKKFEDIKRLQEEQERENRKKQNELITSIQERYSNDIQSLNKKHEDMNRLKNEQEKEKSKKQSEFIKSMEERHSNVVKSLNKKNEDTNRLQKEEREKIKKLSDSIKSMQDEMSRKEREYNEKKSSACEIF